MTRIFEALKKSKGLATPFPFPSSEPAPLRPPAGARAAAPAVPAPSAEQGLAPRIDVVPTAPLSDELVREMTTLRIGLESTLEGQKVRVVMFLSSLHGEGVTTVATQFASLLAADGRGRPLLVGLRSHMAATDLPPGAAAPPARAKRPRAGTAPTGARGPQQGPAAGRGGVPLSVAILTDEIRRAGDRTPAALRAFFATASSQFDWVIVDGPPVLEAPESVHLAPLVDGVVLVVRSGHAKRPVVVRAVELLRKSGARILGSVLSRRRFEIPDFIYRRI